ncbi:hypothetical protein GPP53_002113 [Salmonella enterica]|nr:hypothetical protein [Salmonella enterica]EHC32339.1 hypothetical protein SeGA_4302 [Salmonella enterica subsp. enterica serovar Gaminara str. A4-567]EIT5939443.1 hypothetical protein [Salmonella enterica]ELJ6293458.1 hypothetical protein [Salmonella enterica]
MKRKNLTPILITIMLSGCANHEKIDRLARDIQTLQARVAQVEQDINALRPEIQAAKDEAARANYRIDDRNSPFSPRL